MPIVNRIAAMHGEITAWRRDIHAHPELQYLRLCRHGSLLWVVSRAWFTPGTTPVKPPLDERGHSRHLLAIQLTTGRDQ